MELEVLEPSAAGEVLTLQRAAFATEVRFRFPDYVEPITQTLQELNDEFADQGAIAVGLRDHGRLVAALRMRPKDDGVYFYRLSVAPDKTGERLGATLMEQAIEAAPQLFPDAKRISFNAAGNFEWLIAWYERLGFQVVEKDVDGIKDNWVLARSLP